MTRLPDDLKMQALPVLLVQLSKVALVPTPSPLAQLVPGAVLRPSPTVILSVHASAMDTLTFNTAAVSAGTTYDSAQILVVRHGYQHWCFRCWCCWLVSASGGFVVSVVTPTTALRLASVPSMLVTPPQVTTLYSPPITPLVICSFRAVQPTWLLVSPMTINCLLVWEASSDLAIRSASDSDSALSITPPPGGFFVYFFTYFLFPFPQR